MAFPLRAGAQMSISASASPNPVIVSNTATFTIGVTNISVETFENLYVTNLFSSPILISNPTTSIGTVGLVNSNSVVVFVGQLLSGQFATITFQAEPTNTGSFSDDISAFDFTTSATGDASVTLQSVTSTNVVVPVNLAVAINGPVQAVITNDYMTYNVIVTNATGSSVSDVMLTNVLPAGVIFKSVSPSNLKLSTVRSNQIFSLGTLPVSGLTNVAVTIEPTNAGVLTLSAFIGSSSGTNLNSTNSFATTNITVMDYLPGTLTIVTNSALTLNPQNLLMEQSVLVSNTGATNVPAARIVVSGLTKESLFNAVGTNNGNPFVYYSAPLSTGQSESLLLQYAPRASFILTNGQLQAYAVPLPNWTPPAITGTNSSISTITNVVLSNGNVLVEFPATLGRSYTIIYADNAMMSNAMIAPPAIIAPNNEVQWIDYGPPTTVSAPMSAGARFYEVLLNQ